MLSSGWSKRDWSEVAWFPSLGLSEPGATLTVEALKLVGGRTLLPEEVRFATQACDVILGAAPPVC
jgi:hypothetical protein